MRRATNKDRQVFLNILKTQGPQVAMQRIQQFRGVIDPRDLAEAERAVRQSGQKLAMGGQVLPTWSKLKQGLGV